VPWLPPLAISSWFMLYQTVFILSTKKIIFFYFFFGFGFAPLFCFVVIMLCHRKKAASTLIGNVLILLNKYLGDFWKAAMFLFRS